METSWKDLLARRLPELGHRNWIGVVDMAYPLQTAPGVETVWTGAGFFEVLEAVRTAVRESAHVRAVCHYDAELAKVSGTHAPGVNDLRERLRPLLGEAPVALPHEEIIAKLDEAGRQFRVLLLKTTLTIPYTSVFLRLECAYWSDAAEAALRAA